MEEKLTGKPILKSGVLSPYPVNFDEVRKI